MSGDIIGFHNGGRLEEHLKKTKRSTCGRGILKRHNSDNTIQVIRPRCRRWSCSDCAFTYLFPKLYASMFEAVQKHGLNMISTLTIKHDAVSMEQRLKKLTTAWQKIRAAYLKKFGRSMQFIWVREFKGGYPHLHLIIKDVDMVWLKAEWAARTGAYVVRLEALDLNRFQGWVRYITKDIHFNALKYGWLSHRWYGTSRNIVIQLRPRSGVDSDWIYDSGTNIETYAAIDSGDILEQRNDRFVRPVSVLIKSRVRRV